MKAIAVILYLLIMGVWAYLDADRNNRGKLKIVTNGIASWFIKYGFGFLIILYLFYRSNVPLDYHYTGVFMMFGASGWIVFDATYNIFRKYVKWYHVGTTMFTDKIFHKFKRPFLVQSIVKLILLIGGIIIYYL